MKIEVIDNHSVAVDLLSQGGWVLDAGCRGFVFFDAMIQRGCQLLGLDPAKDIEEKSGAGFFNSRLALVGVGEAVNWTVEYANDPQAARLGRPLPKPHELVPAVLKGPVAAGKPITYFMEKYKVERWEAVKLNIEGSEYAVLETWPGPIAKQISISFHEHVGDRKRGDAAIQKIIDRLSQWYVAVRHVKDARYCAGENYWDTLLVLKELL